MTDETVDILLVEDGEDNAAFFTHALKEAGLSVRLRLVRDGAQALRSIFGEGDPGATVPVMRPRLIILDLKLPKVSGLQVLHRLKANPHTQPIPVVILSSSQEKRDLAESYQLGVNSYLVKPMDFDEFTGLIQALGNYWLKFNQTPKPGGAA